MTEIITSLQNNRVKLAHGLQNRARTRRKERKIVLEGVRLIRDACERGQRPEFILYELRSADFAFISYLQERNFDIAPVSQEVMAHITDTQQPQGILGVFYMPMPPMPRNPKRVLILDAVGDPGNLGTILRTAAAANVEVVVLAPECVDPYNPKCLRAGMGAHFRIPVVEAPWYDIAEYCKDTQILLATGDGDKPYHEVDWTHAWSLIIGSESHGAGGKAAELAQVRIRIPMAADTESLNAGLAAGVILFEAQRQCRFQ